MNHNKITTTSRHRDEIADNIISDCAKFRAWWNDRNCAPPIDEAVVIKAQAAGLLCRLSGMLVLTNTGRKIVRAR